VTVNLAFVILSLADSARLLVISPPPFPKLCLVPQVAWALLASLVGIFASKASWTEVRLPTPFVFSPHRDPVHFYLLNSSHRVIVLELLQMICVLQIPTHYAPIWT
jgi:hypothetical protein